MTRTNLNNTVDETFMDDSTIAGTDSASTNAGSPLNEAGREATESIGQIAGRAADVGLQRADQGKDQAAQTITRLAGSMRQISTDLEGDQPAIAGVARTAAEQAERLATYVERTDTRQIIGSVEDAARRQPLLFLGGAFALGVVAARLLKAGTGTDQDRMRYGQANGYTGSTRVGEFDGRTSRRS
jgi:hypothetical protein